jgi:hypothetical protein
MTYENMIFRCDRRYRQCPFQAFFCQWLVNCMVWHHRKIVLISALFSIAQLNVGCSPRPEVKIPDLKERTEEVFCAAHPNATQLDSLENSWFYVSIGYSEDLRKNVVRINARKNDSSPILMIGSNFLQEGDIFNLKKSKWEILKIGNGGVNVNGMEWCRGDFVHIKLVRG